MSHILFTLQGHPWGKAAETPLSGPLFGVRDLGPVHAPKAGRDPGSPPLQGRGAQIHGTGLRCSVSALRPPLKLPFHVSSWGTWRECVWDLAGCSGAQHLHNHQAGPHRLHLASTRVASSPGKGGWTPACGLPHTQPGVTRELSCKPLSLPLEAPKTAGHVRMPRPAPFRLKSGYPSTSMAGAPAGSPGPSTAVWCCTDLDASLVFEASRSRPHTCTARSGRHRAGPGGG